MKKILFASTALVAFGLAGAAQAADPISLKLGGYAKWLVGFSEYDGPADRQNADIHADAEVFFLGSTTLDNGLKIGIKVELEADRSAGGAAGSANQGANTIDETFITIDSAIGRVIVGNEDNGAYLLHVSAPDAAGMAEDNPVALKNLAPGAVTAGAAGGPYNIRATTAINTDSDDQKITYVAPSFAGFTVGASYIPALGSEGVTPHVRGFQADAMDVFGFAGAYNNTFGAVGLKASFGWATLMDDLNTNVDHNEFSFGAQFGYAGFTLGGAAKIVDSDVFGDFENWTIGLQYGQGPWAASVAYYVSDAGTGIDDYRDVHVSGKYTMGPGVDVIGSVGYVERDGAAATSFDGWAGLVGLSLAF